MTAAEPPPDYLENGRKYHGYRRGIYMYPCDETEMERLDIYNHIIYTVARKGELHRVPLIPTGETLPRLRILDVGCGTGIWAIEMADKFREAEVIGTDLALIQPALIPSNLRFRQRDFDSPWVMGEDSWDLIHLGMLCGSVQSWREMYGNVMRHLKPGTGHLEQVEIDLEPRCDDGTLGLNSSYRAWYHRYLTDATDRAHRPIAYLHQTPNLLRDMGFVDVEVERIQLPIGEWSRDNVDLGRWYRLGICEALEALSLAPFTRPQFSWPVDDAKRYVKEVQGILRRADIHAYNFLYIITARKPGKREPC
ncbi:hypothetical protein ABVK25_003072 [Lepraria finkii]|uniref:Methyltransferase LaeA n=1 Tax=Lepraria finkii TaxID=1340010 RepID=A0ABR4BL40_9LECA